MERRGLVEGAAEGTEGAAIPAAGGIAGSDRSKVKCVKLTGTQVFGATLSHEIRPGFFASTCDVTYRSDMAVTMETAPSLFFGVITGQDSSQLRLDGAQAREVRPLAPLLIAFGDTTPCVGLNRAGMRIVSIGLSITRSGLESLARDFPAEPFETFLRMMDSGLMLRRLPMSDRLLATAASMAQNPYQGGLATLHRESCALGLLAELGRITLEETAGAVTAGLTQSERERAYAVKSILEADIVNTPTLNELSRQVGINATSLSQQFKKAFGVTIFAFVRGRRLELARTMLKNQAIPVSQVGYRIGFNNPGAFATAYRRHFGCSPSEDSRNLH